MNRLALTAEQLVGRQVEVRVPATVANLGAGYDVLGLALDLYNDLRVAVTGVGAGSVEYAANGEGAATLPATRANVAIDAVYRGLIEAGVAPAEANRLQLAITAVNRIPLARGLGSSAAAVVAGLAAGAALVAGEGGTVAAPGTCVEAFDDELIDRLFAAASQIEGHPDNAAAALFGGLVASGEVDGGVNGRALTARLIGTPEDTVPVILIPELELPTALMRAALPKSVPLADASHNASRLALGVAALEAGDLQGFALLADDRLHQPYRAKRYAALPTLIASALGAGAVSACLAGAGSAILAIVDDAGGDAAIARVIAALDAAAVTTKVGGHARQYEIDIDGVTIVSSAQGPTR